MKVGELSASCPRLRVADRLACLCPGLVCPGSVRGQKSLQKPPSVAESGRKLESGGKPLLAVKGCIFVELKISFRLAYCSSAGVGPIPRYGLSQVEIYVSQVGRFGGVNSQSQV